MKFPTQFLSIVSFLFFTLLSSRANPVYVPLPMTGYNADVICTDVNCSEISTIDDLWFYYAASKKSEGAVPQDFTSQMGVPYQLADFEQNNVLLLAHDGTKSGVLTLTTPVKATELWLLGLSASKQKDIEVEVSYTDNSTSEKFKFSFPDWYQGDGSKAALYGLGRVRGNSSYDGRNNFGLFERVIPVDANKTVKSVSFTYPGSDKSYTGIFAITAYQGGRAKSDKELYMIANAHFDTQWDWDVQTSIDQYVKNTLEGNFNLFDKYPNYKFNFEGAIKYMFAKEYYPDLYERLKGYIAADRWRVSGSSVDANDVMVPSAESIIRNLLLGHKFFMQEFGVDGGNDIMLPDCFGFPHTLPTLAAHCGIVGFHSQKLSWGSAYDYNSLPHFGLWKGVDGSVIYAGHKLGAYVNQYKENMSYNGDVLNEIIANKASLGSNKTVRYFGTGDRGGSVDESTANWMEKSLASDGPVNVNLVSPDEFFASFTPAERAALPIWDNELPMRSHGVGCYSSHAILKYWNRKGELLADATEKSSVVADWLGGLSYQKETINDAWIRLLWHQFHDDLTGTSIPRAYVFTNNDHVMGLLNFSKTLDNAVGAVAKSMNTQTQGIPIVINNPLSIEREDIVEAQIQLTSQPNNLSVYDTSGNVVPAQILGFKDGVLDFIFKAKVPSLGYVTYDLRLNDDSSSKLSSNLQITDNSIENEDYKLTLNRNGDVTSILDKKQQNKELLKSPIRLSLQSNRPGYWASWEISWGDVDRNPFAFVDENVHISIEEDGPLRSTLKITRTKQTSQFVQFISLTSGVNTDRIDFRNEVDWQSKQTLLKAVFPLTVNNPIATYDASIGAVERGNRNGNLYEVAGHQWADITHGDNSYGISILNDSKYGWDKPNNNEIRLTLIHTPGVESDRPFQQYQDLGLNKFTFAFYRHMGKWNEQTQWAASKLNQPLIAYSTSKHDGPLGKSFEFAKLNTDKVAIKALKQAEDDDEIVVRMYELTGQAQQNIELSFASNIISARELNGREQPIGDIDFQAGKITFDLTKYQPRTFAVKLQKNENLSSPEPNSLHAELPYNIDVMSFDHNKRNGRFGTSMFSYPAELFTDTLVSDGIRFTVGPREDRLLNAVQCKGQQINIPSSHKNKKLYVLAASQHEAGTSVDFLIDGIAKPVHVEYFAEYVGTWGTVYSDRNFKKENIAFTATHRHNYSSNKNDAYAYLYIFKYVFEIDADAKVLTLPNNEDVIVFAVTASDNNNDDVKVITDLKLLPEFEHIDALDELTPCGERLVPQSVTASGQTNINERAALAADNNPYTKWNDDSNAAKWIQYTFAEPVQICQWNVLHAGLEGDENITSDFTLQYRDGNNWIDVDEVVGNKENKTIRGIQSFEASVIRLKITKPQQNNGNTARIYSFDVFGNSATGVRDLYNEDALHVYVKDQKEVVIRYSPVGKEISTDLKINVYNLYGQKIWEQPYSFPETTINSIVNAGIYMIQLGNHTQKIIIR